MKITMPRRAQRGDYLAQRRLGGGTGSRPRCAASARASVAQWPRARPRRRDGANRLVEGDQAGSIALPQQHECERRGKSSGVVELGEAVRRTAPRHRRAGIEHQHRAEVGLLLELLDVEAVGAAEQLPVHVARFVARLVLPVLGELHRKPAPRRTMQAGQKPLDDALGEDFEAAEAGDIVGLQEIGANGGRGVRTWGSKKVSS